MGLVLDEPKEDEKQEQIDGVRFVMGNAEEPFLDERVELVVDYVDSGWGKGFDIRARTPGLSGSCC